MTRPTCKGDVLTHVRPVGDDMAVSGGGDVAVVPQEGGREVKTRVHAACEPAVALRRIGKGGGHLGGGEGKRLRGDLGRHRSRKRGWRSRTSGRSSRSSACRSCRKHS